MPSKILVVFFALAACALAPAQWVHDVTAHPVAPIPSSGSGGAANQCANPVNKTTIQMPCQDSVRIKKVRPWVLMNHTFAHDLVITISHGGTSVTVFDQFLGSAYHAFSGYYAWDDAAGQNFSAAIVPFQTVLHFGTYTPAQPLSVFDGMSGAGPWTLEICDLAQGDLGTLTDCGVTFESGASYDDVFQLTQLMLDGGAGGCVAPLTHVVAVPANNGPVSRLQVGVGLSHQRAGDVTINLAHGGVSVNLCTANPAGVTPSIGGGQYLFADDAATTWSAALSTNWQVIPAALYRPQSPLSAFDGVESGGVWLLTICDAVGNVQVGTLSAIYFSVEVSAYKFDITQPNGSSSAVLKNSGGIPGDHYLNAFTFVPGSYPYGWLNGLDIAMTDLVAQVNAGSPYFGTLDSSGGATVTIPGPIPPQITVQYVSFDVTPGGIPVSSIPARSFTTVP